MADENTGGAEGGGWAAVDPSTIYPAEHHFRIIVGQDFACEPALRQVLARYTVTSPLADASQSRNGRFRSLQASVRVDGREELVRLDRELRAVEGVRLIL